MEWTLSELYRTIRPGVTHLYVMPDIPAVSARNPYLALLYKPLEADQDIAVSSSSFLSPGLIWRRLLGEASVLHHHWFECSSVASLLNACWKLLWGCLYVLSGGKLVWTVHNLAPHSRRYRRANRLLRRLWARLPQRLHVHCKAAIPLAAAATGRPAECFVVIPHPPYPATIMPPDTARRVLLQRYPELTIRQGPLLLMSGYIAEYKGIGEVLELLAEQRSWRLQLLIAGPVKRYEEPCAARIRELAAGDRRVMLIDRFIPEADLPLFMNSADVVLFNYREVLHSGGVVLARSYRRPVIAPAKGCLAEPADEYIRLFYTRDELAAQLAACGTEQS